MLYGMPQTETREEEEWFISHTYQEPIFKIFKQLCNTYQLVIYIRTFQSKIMTPQNLDLRLKIRQSVLSATSAKSGNLGYMMLSCRYYFISLLYPQP